MGRDRYNCLLEFFACSALCVLCVFCVVGNLPGCAATRQATSLPDRATLVVTVNAEPKQGWHDPRSDSTYTGLRPGESRQFETVDYAHLDDIVVCVEPANDAGPPTIVLGPAWARGGGSGFDRDVVLRTEDGRVTPLPRGKALPADITGYVEITAASHPQPAGLFIAPSRHARPTKSGTPVTFSGLPPGPARVTAWHPRLPGSAARVNLEAGKSSSVTVTVGVNALPKVQ